MRIRKRHVISFAISIILLVLLFYKANFSEVISAISKANVTYILFAIICAFTVLGLRLLRWQILLSSYKLKMRRFDVVSSYLASQFLANLTPARVGDVSRPYFLKKRYRTSFFRILPAVVVERFIDAVVLLIISLAFFAFFSFRVSQTFQAMLLLFSLLLLMILIVILKENFALRISNHLLKIFGFVKFVNKLKPEIKRKVGNFYRGLSTIHLTKSFQVLIITFFCYVFEGAILYFAALALLGSPISFPFAVGFVSLAIIGGAISTLPGGLGSLEAILFALLMLIGFSDSIAFSITILYRFVSFVIIVSFCSLFFFREAR